MASVVPRPLPPSKQKTDVQNGPSRKRAPSPKSNIKLGPIHKQKNGTKESRGDATHIIRVNVLGLAGITVDRNKCRDRSSNKVNPAPPSNMRAVVAFSRGQQIRGTTTLSKPLTRSPNDDIVVPGSATDEDISLVSARHGKSRKDDETMTQATDYGKVQRHVAVWATDDDMTLGSMVTFDTNLRRLDSGNSTSATATSSSFVPKSFELTIALTEHTKTDNKVALPFGVANLNIAGDECPRGETLVIDLPILSLAQARPLASNKNGLGSYQMIAIRPKNGTEAPPAKKRSGLKRFFGRNQVDHKIPKIPSIAERRSFSEAYTTDPSGDAILRVQLQVVEKGSVAKFRNVDYKLKTSIAPTIPTPSGTGKPVPTTPQEHRDKQDKLDIANPATDSISEIKSSKLEESLETTTVSDDETSDSGLSTLVSTESASGRSKDSNMGSINATMDSIIDSSALQDIEPEVTGDDGIVEGLEQPPAFDANMDSSNDESASFVGNCNARAFDDDLNLAVIKFFGREVRIPSCGPLTVVETENGPRAKLFDDEITHVTADFFGRDVPIPICASIKPPDDDDTLTINLNDTFSTISDHTAGNQRRNLLRSFLRGQLVGDPIETDDKWATNNNADEDQLTVDATLDGSLDNTVDRTLDDTYDGTLDGTQDGTQDGSIDGTLDGTLDDTLDGTVEDTVEDTLEATLEGTLEGTQTSKEVSQDDINDVTQEVENSDALETNEDMDGSQLGSLVSGSGQQQPIELVIKGSPKGVADVVTEERSRSKVNKSSKVKKASERKTETSPLPTMSEKFAQIFYCGPSSVDDTTEVLEKEVPEMVIPSDSNSVGELTASTYELKINRAKRKLLESKKKDVNRTPLPIACGGNGMCTSVGLMAARDALAGGIKFTASHSGEKSRSRNENYFSEYDDYSFQSNTPKDKDHDDGSKVKASPISGECSPNDVVVPRRTRSNRESE